MAAKRTHELIPLCHLLVLTGGGGHRGRRGAPGPAHHARGALPGRTGVEMEALAAVSVAALTIYDMCKAVDRGMEITAAPAEKSGGRSGHWTREGAAEEQA